MSDSVTEELGKLFEKLESVARETKLEEKKKIDYVETTESDLSSLFTELEKVSQETKTSNESSKDKLNEFASLFENISQQKEDYPDDLPSDVEPAPEDDPTDDVTSDVGEWIKKDVDKNDKKVKAIEELFASLNDISINEPVEEKIVEEIANPVESIIPEKSKKSKTIKKAMISVNEQKYMSSFLDEIAKPPPEEKPVDVSEQSFPNSIKDSLLTPDQTSLQRKVAQPEDSLTRLRKEFEQFRTVMQRNLESKENAFSGYGSGEVNLRKLDDVDDSAKQNGFALKYNSSTDKFDFGEVASDLSAVDQDIIPDGTGTRSLGSASKRWKDIFLSGQTINLGGATISSDGTGTIAIAATGATLPAGSKAGDNQLAVVSTGSAGAAGQVSRVIPFFSAAGGLSTKNTDFEFNAIIDEKFVFTGTKTFTLANGSALADSDPTLFQF